MAASERPCFDVIEWLMLFGSLAAHENFRVFYGLLSFLNPFFGRAELVLNFESQRHQRRR